MHNHCKTCDRLKARDNGGAPLWDSIFRVNYWDVVHSYSTSLKGWLVLVARRHIESIDQLTEDESVELGRLLRLVSIALKSATGCQKTYVIQFAEHPDHPHVHFHVIPRMADQPDDKKGAGIFGYLGVPQTECVSEDDMNEISKTIQTFLAANWHTNA